MVRHLSKRELRDDIDTKSNIRSIVHKWGNVVCVNDTTKNRKLKWVMEFLAPLNTDNVTDLTFNGLEVVIFILLFITHP